MGEIKLCGQFRIFSPDSPVQFNHYFEFRWRLLRQPWNQPKGSEQDDLEQDSFHIMAVDNREIVVGVGRLHFNNENEAQVRYMAVDESCRKQGLGSAILEQLESVAINENARTVMLNARKSAVNFYQNRGYKICGDAETLFGEISHVKMMKRVEKN